ncbi:hypothetical protein ACQ4PT_047656 [Festuca glaucescens]
MPRPSVEIRRRRALILNDGDEDDDGGRAGEAGAQPVAAARGPEIIAIDDDGEEEGTEVVTDAEVQLGEGGGLVKEEPPSDSDSDDVDWDELERLYPSDEERSGKASYAGGRRSGGPNGSPCGEVNGGTSRGTGTGWQEGACEVGEVEMDLEVGEVEMDLEDNDGAEEGQDHQEDKDEDECEVEEEEEEDDDEETEEDEAGDEESEAGGEPGRRVPSNARAAAGGHAGDCATEIILRRFEGWLISGIADTANAAGSTVAARTRSRRRCPNRKLLRRGTCSKPYCVDTASSESGWESDEEDAPPCSSAVVQ